MNLVGEGLATIVVTGTVAAMVIATAVWKRSWPLWLLGYVLLLVTVWVAFTVRTPGRPPSRTAIAAAGSTAWHVPSRRIEVVVASPSTPHS